MVKFIWILIGINTIALLIFIGSYFVYNNSRQPDSIETSWTFVMAGIGLCIILLAALPLRYIHSTGAVVFSGIIAILPLAIATGMFLSNELSALKKQKTFAETYYTDKTQRRTAAAIEQNDTLLLKQLIKGQNLSIAGTGVPGVESLTYLEFAIQLRSNPTDFPYNEEVNDAAIRILVENGSPPIRSMEEAVRYLSPKIITLLIDKGANPNTAGFSNSDPPLFTVISYNDTLQNEIAILLIQKGADVNAKNEDGFTPVMYAAYLSGTYEFRFNTWHLVRYLLQDAHADINHTNDNGLTLNSIIQEIVSAAKDKNMVMPQDFNWVVEWLQAHHAA